jgi:hypothetical protein
MIKTWLRFPPVYISNLSSINKRNNGGYDIYILNRTTGEPEKEVLVTPYTSNYNYTSRKYELKKGNSQTTGEDGFVRIESEMEQRNFSLELSKGNDILFLNDNLHIYNYHEQNNSTLTTYFFTDRSIYRPGQTIYFKGIVLESDSSGSRIKKNFKSNVEFFDVNSQKVSALQLTTNEYGTFNGSFTAPQGLLTGMMRIQNENGSTYFSVEEYKRPKFEVTFSPLQGTFIVKNRVTVTGSAKSYTGAAISDGKVSYRVTRTARIPEWWYWSWKGIWPRGAETEITNGETTTDSAGNFTITFDLVPDEKLPKESNPVFNFKVNAGVTDMNGETRSSETIVGAGYQALFLETDVEDYISVDHWDSLLIRSRNMSGLFEGAKGSIQIHRLEQPEKLFRKRMWDMPDRHTMTKEEFQRDFPNDIYEKENDPSAWKKKEEVLNAFFDTEKDSVLTIPGSIKSSQGSFVIELNSKDKFENDVRYIKYFTLFSIASKNPPIISFFSFIPVKTKAEPGEKAQFLLGSSDKKIKVLYELEQDNKILKHEWINLDEEQKLIEVPILEQYRGNISVHLTSVKQNRIYEEVELITVPWSNKEINISMETFRDKLLPGSKEEWRIKLSGKFSEKIAAEFLAGMYDASLDAFKPHSWNFNVWQNNFPAEGFEPGSMFSPVTSAVFSKERYQIPALKFRSYDALNWFGYNPGSQFSFSDGDGVRLYEVQMSANGAGAQKAKAEDRKSFSDKNAVEAAMADSADVAREQEKIPAGVQPRKNFNETAFFYPALMTNEKNEVIFSFVMPEALTRWKFMGLTHTQNLEYGYIEKEIVTRKELMVVPNAPRFLREGDTLEFPCKITNLSDTLMEGSVSLTLYDALTETDITSNIILGDASLKFLAAKGGNANAAWKLAIPTSHRVVKYRLTAVSKNFSDGEEQAIPVLSNRMLVTESLPLWVNSGQQKSFTFDKLKNNSSSTLQNHKLTLEFTSNPAWYAVQALPYLMEYPHECAEQIFSRFYSNALASHIANSNPKIKEVFDAWKNESPESFLSSLGKKPGAEINAAGADTMGYGCTE